MQQVSYRCVFNVLVPHESRACNGATYMDCCILHVLAVYTHVHTHAHTHKLLVYTHLCAIGVHALVAPDCTPRFKDPACSNSLLLLSFRTHCMWNVHTIHLHTHMLACIHPNLGSQCAVSCFLQTSRACQQKRWATHVHRIANVASMSLAQRSSLVNRLLIVC